LGGASPVPSLLRNRAFFAYPDRYIFSVPFNRLQISGDIYFAHYRTMFNFTKTLLSLISKYIMSNTATVLLYFDEGDGEFCSLDSRHYVMILDCTLNDRN